MLINILLQAVKNVFFISSKRKLFSSLLVYQKNTKLSSKRRIKSCLEDLKLIVYSSGVSEEISRKNNLIFNLLTDARLARLALWISSHRRFPSSLRVAKRGFFYNPTFKSILLFTSTALLTFN